MLTKKRSLMATNNIIASTATSVEGAAVALESAESRENSNNSLGGTEVKFKVNFNPKAICILAGAALAVFIGVRVTNKAVGK